MPWVKLDDGFDEHQELEALTDGALRMLVCSWTFSGRNLTDGFIPENRVLRLTPTAKPKYIAELLSGGHWVQVPGGYQVPSFLDYNPSKAKVMDERAQAAERQRRSRESRRDTSVTSTEVLLPRPDPTRSIRSVTNCDPDVDKAVEEPASLEVVKDNIATARTSLRSGKAS